MSTYAIGDIQGCYHELIELLKALKFDKNKDKLWFTGDIVNRGRSSLDALRFVRNLGDSAVTVLGNHDLHLIALAHGVKRHKKELAVLYWIFFYILTLIISTLTNINFNTKTRSTKWQNQFRMY